MMVNGNLTNNNGNIFGEEYIFHRHLFGWTGQRRTAIEWRRRTIVTQTLEKDEEWRSRTSGPPIHYTIQIVRETASQAVSQSLYFPVSVALRLFSIHLVRGKANSQSNAFHLLFTCNTTTSTSNCCGAGKNSFFYLCCCPKQQTEVDNEHGKNEQHNRERRIRILRCSSVRNFFVILEI